MREEVTYYAEDGTKFVDKQECLDYENNLHTVKNWTNEDINKIYETLELIKSYCQHSPDCSRNCPFDCICEECVDDWKIPNPKEDIKVVEEEIKDFKTTSKVVATTSYWIQVESDKDENDFYCSNCGRKHLHTLGDLPPFCDFCGSPMEDSCITIPICSCYDLERCNGTRERDWVTCCGDRMNCKIYDYVPEKALKEANDLHWEKEKSRKSKIKEGEENVYINLGSVSNPTIDEYYIAIRANEDGKHALDTAFIGKLLNVEDKTFKISRYADLAEFIFAWREKTGKYLDYDLYPLHMSNITRFRIGVYIYLKNKEDIDTLSQYAYNIDECDIASNIKEKCVVYIKDNKIISWQDYKDYYYNNTLIYDLIWTVDKYGFLHSFDVAEHIKQEDIKYVINTENQCIYEVTYLSPSKTRLDILPNHGEESLYICKNTPLVHPYVPLTLDKIELYNIDIVLQCDKQETVKRIFKCFDLAPIYSDLIVSIENGEVKECSNGTIYTNFPRFDVSINEKNELEFTYAFSCK